MKSNAWHIIEWDQNLRKIFDIVTNEHAEDMEVGQMIIVVCSDHEGGRLNFGYAFFARITSLSPIEDGLTIVRADFLDSTEEDGWLSKMKQKLRFSR